MKQQAELQRISELFARWLAQIRLNTALTFYDINKISEDFACKLLNVIYDHELINLNNEQKNFPGIDLGDKTKSLLAFQVTSRTDSEKIRTTLGTFVTKKYDKVFTQGLRFLILNQEKIKFGKFNLKKIYGPFSKSKHVITDKILFNEISNIYVNNPQKFILIKQILESEFGEQANIEKKIPPIPLKPDTHLFIFGQENSFFPFAANRKKGRIKISVKPIDTTPELHDIHIPQNLFEWKYPPNTKLFTVYCENCSDVIDSNIKVDLHFSHGTSIISIEITNNERLQILSGGKAQSNFVSFYIPQLLPKERQELRIVTKGKSIRSASCWSEKTGHLKETYTYDILFSEPEELLEIPKSIKPLLFEVG